MSGFDTCFTLCTILICSTVVDPQIIDLLHYYKHFHIVHYGCNTRESIVLTKRLASDGYINSCLTRSGDKSLSNRIFNRYLHIVDLECEETRNVLKKANEFNLYSAPTNSWLIVYRNETLGTSIENVLTNSSIMVDSDVTIAERQLGNEQIIIKQIYRKHKHDQRFCYNTIAIWTKNEGLMRHAHYDSSLKSSRGNLGVTLKATMVITNNDSLNHLTDRRNKHIDSLAKVNYVLVMTLASVYNITLKFAVVNTWGYKINNSKWTGMMGDLTDGDADIGATSLFLIKDRIGLIDYIAMITPTRSKFVFRQPKLSYVTNVYSLPFDSRVWICSIVAVLLMALLLYLLLKWESFINYRNHLTQFPGSLLDVVVLTVGATCQQGAAVLPTTNPARITTFVMFISLMFIYVSYSANIVALLQTSSSSIKTIKDLLDSRIAVGVHDTVYFRFYFAKADEPVRHELYVKKVAPPGKPANFMPIEDGIRRMRNGLFAFHMETGAGYKLIGETFLENEKCDLYEIPFIQVVDPYIAIRARSPYKELFKIAFHMMRENGILQRERNLIYTKKPVCTSKSSTFISVGIIDCYAPLILFIAGVFTSLAMFLLELLKLKQLTVRNY